MKEFPKMTREQNRRCKLSDSDIEEIRELRNSGSTLKSIATLFGITEQSVHYWLQDKNQRKAKNKEAYRKRVLNGVKSTHKDSAYYKKYRERKKKLHGEEYLKYENQFTTEYKKKNRPNYQEVNKRADKKYRDKLPKGYRYNRMIERWGKDVWNKYHYLKRRGIYKSFQSIADELQNK